MIKLTFVAKILLVISLMAVYFAGAILLFADTLPLFWALIFITLHIFYSWGIVWFYAYLKVQNKEILANLFIPILTTTSTIGIVIWIVFRPEARIRRWHHRY